MRLKTPRLPRLIPRISALSLVLLLTTLSIYGGIVVFSPEKACAAPCGYTDADAVAAIEAEANLDLTGEVTVLSGTSPGFFIHDTPTGTGQTYALVASDISANRNITLPALTASDVFVFEAQTQTLTNKTFTSPSFGGFLSFTTSGTATAANWQIGRNADGTNLLQLNAPTGASIEISVNDVAEYVYSATQADFNSNNIVNLGTVNTHTVPGGTSTFAVTGDNLSVFATTTSAQLAGVISNETGTGLAVFGTSPAIASPTLSGTTTGTYTLGGTPTLSSDLTWSATSPTLTINNTETLRIQDASSNLLATINDLGATGSVVTSVFSQDGDSADAGTIRLQNAANIAWEASPAGTDYTLGVDSSEILQASGTFNASTLTESSNAVPNSTDNLSFFSATTSAQLAGVISNETGSGLLTFATTPTFTTSITTPILLSGVADPADAGAIRFANAEVIGWEASPAGTDVTLTVDASEIMQASGTFNAVTLRESNNAVPTDLDDLGFFDNTTSAQLRGVLSDETGSGLAVFGTAPTITTSLSQSGDAADAGFLRLQNAADIAWEAAPAGTDYTLGVDSSEILQASGAFNATGAITGSNLSGTNTGDQTITLTSDVTGSGTGSFATTIAANAVALTTDTTGNYVLTLAEGLAIDVTGADAEGATKTVVFDPTELTGSRTFGDASTDTIVWTWDRLSATDPAITFGGGNVNITTGNLQVSGTNVLTENQTITLTGDVTGSGATSIATTIAANSVALGTDTTGNYVANASTSALTGLTGGSGGSEAASLSLAFDYTATLAANPTLGASDCVFATTGIICEGATANLLETLLTFVDPTVDRTITFPNASGTLIFDSVTTLSSLASVGTIITGTWSATDIAVPDGGSGRGTATAHAVITGGTTSTAAHQSVSGLGSSGDVLTSNGAGTLPTWQVGGANTALSNLASVAINLSLVSDTDVTDDLGSTAIRWRDIYAATLNTGDTAADTLLLRARDVDGATWTTFATLTANNVPTMDLATGVTLGSNTIATTNLTLASFATTTSAQLASVLSDETGSGSAVFGTSPTLAGTIIGTYTLGGSPTLGTATLSGTLSRAANQILDLTGAATRTLTLQNSTASQVANLDVDGVLLWRDGHATGTFTFAGTPTAARTLTWQNASGTIYISGGTDVSVADGGTGASVAATALSNLGGIGAATTDTLTNKTFDANAAGNSLSNVDVADLASGTDGELITWDTAAAPTTVAAGSSGQVLTSNGAGTAPTFQAAAGGQVSLLRANSGTSTTTTTHNLDTVAISGLAADDRILVYTWLEAVTQNTGFAGLHNDTDGVDLTYVGSGSGLTIGTDDRMIDTHLLTQNQDSATAVTGQVTGVKLPGSGATQNALDTAVTTAWTGSWTLALRVDSIVSGGTLRWRWLVYKLTSA